jgi:hypothetical protein
MDSSACCVLFSAYRGQMGLMMHLSNCNLQVRQLRAIQRLPFRDQSFNGKYMIPTFEEYIDVALNAGRPVGVYPG